MWIKIAMIIGVWREKGTYERFRSSILAEAGFELLVAGIGGLHDAVANNAGNDAADGGEGQEERL